MSLRFVQTPACALYTGISASDTTMRITPYPTDLDGTKLTITDFGATPTCTVDPKVSGYEEIIQFTGITDNGDNTATLTGLSRDLTSKYPYTTAGTGKTHGSSAVVVFSDNPQVYGRLAAKENDEAITGSWTFPTPTDPANPATKAYADAIAAGTGPAASAATLGLTKLSYNPSLSLGVATITIASPGVVSKTAHCLIAGDQVKFTTTGALPTGIVAGTVYYVISAGLTANAFELAATLGGTAINTTGTQSGVHTLFRVTPFAVADNDPRILQNAFASDAVGTDAYAITLGTPPTAYADGQVYLFKVQVGNTGACTLNVNSLGAKALKKNRRDDLVNGDIIAGQIVQAVYDATLGWFQIPTSPSVNAPTADIDQSQVTQDGSVAVGEANATTKKNKFAQSFIPTHSKIRGVRLYKAANTGTFTGTVTVALQADSAGAPSGSNLASQTMTNAAYLALPTGSFEIAFTSQYDLLTPDATYWIVISTSTGDTSNHPNLGMITAGAYANGSTKYNNTTDGWVTGGAIDLWFQTLNGWSSNIVSTDTVGNIPGSISPIGVIDMDTTQTTVNTTNTETTVYTRTLPNNTFSTNSGILVKVLATVQFDASGHQVQFRLKLNGNLIGVSLLGGNSTGAQTGILTWIEFWVMNNNSLSVQKAITTSMGVKPTQTADGSVSEVDVTAYAVDTSAAQNILTVTIAPSISNASLGATCNAIIVSKIGL